jgi:hypothetical protein
MVYEPRKWAEVTNDCWQKNLGKRVDQVIVGARPAGCPG